MDKKSPEKNQHTDSEQAKTVVEMDEAATSRRSFTKSALRAAPIIMTMSGVSLVSKPTAVAAASGASAASNPP